MNQPTLLITGASGYLGRRVTQQLLAQGATVLALTVNVQDVPPAHPHLHIYPLTEFSVADVFEQNKVDGVFHFATSYGRNGQSADEVARVNLLFPLSVLAQAVKHGAQFFINTDTILEPFINPYALSKHQFTNWLQFYAGQIKCINMRLDHFYGPHDHPVKFIAWLIEQLKQNVPAIDLTEGAQLRDFIYIDDVVSAFLCTYAHRDQFSLGDVHTFEVGSGTKTSIKQMVLLLQQLMHKEQVQLRFGAVPYRPHERLDYPVNIAPLRALGWRAKTDLKTGLTEILKQEHYL